MSLAVRHYVLWETGEADRKGVLEFHGCWNPRPPGPSSHKVYDTRMVAYRLLVSHIFAVFAAVLI
jgi:hypothetical protein